MKVMVVDDEQDVKFLFQQKFRRELKTGRIDLHFAFSGETALAHLENDPGHFNLVFSDINMPGMNGLELLRKIKEKFKSLAVCMITAYGDEANCKQAREFGCDEYFTKPIDFEAIKQKIFGKNTANGKPI